MCNIIYISQIHKIEENSGGHKDHFKVLLRTFKLTETEAIHIKCGNEIDRANWIKALRFFKEYYKELDR